MGYMLLFSFVPLVGFIIQLVFAFGGCKKINLRNYCRALLLIQVISVVLAVLLVVLIVLFAGAATGFSMEALDEIINSMGMY